MKFRSKVVEIEAIEWTGENIEQIMSFMYPDMPVYMPGFKNSDEIIGIDTLEGRMIAQKGDWLIKGVKGEFYPCKPDVFAMKYERIEKHPQGGA